MQPFSHNLLAEPRLVFPHALNCHIEHGPFQQQAALSSGEWPLALHVDVGNGDER